MSELFVLGGGPKGIAIGAKLRALAPVHHFCSVIERYHVGAQWSGSYGFTDGSQRLTTLPEHDIAYPYKSELVFGNKLGLRMNEFMQRYSWDAFLVEKGMKSSWLLQTENHPSHAQFVEYLGWAADKAGVMLIKRTCPIKGISISNGKWNLSFEESGDLQGGDGLVITGHGGQKRFKSTEYQHARISHGRDFWTEEKLSQYLQVQSGDRIAVVGAGETAGAIAARILDQLTAAGFPRSNEARPLISLICRRPSYFPRSDLFKDVKFYSNPIGWRTENLAQRRAIMDRADKGVVSKNIKEKLESSDLVNYRQAEVDWPDGYTVPATGRISLLLKFQDEFITDAQPEEFDFVTFALGFDDMWFVDLCDDAVRDALYSHIINAIKDEWLKFLATAIGATGVMSKKELIAEAVAKAMEPSVKKVMRFYIESMIDYDLSLRGFRPRLHLPRLSGLEQGPGFPNLTCLGLMSDRIWSAYMPINYD